MKYFSEPKYNFRLALHSRDIPGRDPLDREGSRGQAEEEMVGGAEGRRLLQGGLPGCQLTQRKNVSLRFLILRENSFQL